MNELGKINLTHHGRHDVRILQVEIIVGPVEVSRHDGNIVGTILQVVALAHLQSCNLGNSILLVGVLKGRCEQGIFLHRLGSILGIDAGGAQEQKFLNAMGIGLANDITLDLHVHHDEIGTIE